MSDIYFSSECDPRFHEIPEVTIKPDWQLEINCRKSDVIDFVKKTVSNQEQSQKMSFLMPNVEIPSFPDILNEMTTSVLTTEEQKLCIDEIDAFSVSTVSVSSHISFIKKMVIE